MAVFVGREQVRLRRTGGGIDVRQSDSGLYLLVSIREVQYVCYLHSCCGDGAQGEDCVVSCQHRHLGDEFSWSNKEKVFLGWTGKSKEELGDREV